MIEETFTLLTVVETNINTDKDTFINIKMFCITNTDTASPVHRKRRRAKKPNVTANIIGLCDERRELDKKKKEPEDAIE